jgi:hypothetical protein
VDLRAWLHPVLGIVGLIVGAGRPPVVDPAPEAPADPDVVDADDDADQGMVDDGDERSPPPEVAPDPERGPEREPDEVPVGATD